VRFVWVLFLSLLVCQAPAATYNTIEGFACRTPELWIEYAQAIKKSDSKTIRNIRLSQRCVDIRPGEIELLERDGDFLLIKANASRKLYIPKAYVKE
jgi:hypothetical protein